MNLLERLRKILSFRILQVEVSRECNLDCKICMRKNLKSNSGFLSFDNFTRIVDSYNFKEVALHGWGEPLLNPDIFQMIKYAKDKGIRTSLTTNGTLVGDNIDNIFNSNLDDIAFGFYDTNILMKSIDNVRELVNEKKIRKSDLRIFFDITIFKDNLYDVPNVIRKADEIGADACVLHRLFNIYNVDKKFKPLSKMEEKELFTQVKDIEKKLNFKVYLPKEHDLPCRIVKNTVFVTHEGKVTPCCFLPEFYIGDTEDGIGNIMKSEKYMNFLGNMKNHDVCSKCIW